MHGFTRFLIGAAGGLMASASKILAIDIEKLQRFVESGLMSEISELKVTIYIFTPILMLLGALVAWASDEKHRMKLLAIGCAAPALVAPWTTGNLSPVPAAPPVRTSWLPLVQPAHAQALAGDDGKTSGTSYFTGVRVLLGLKDLKSERYWVVVGSRREVNEALEYAAAINALDPDIDAFVGERKPDNSYYPIIVGGPNAYLPLDEANALKERAKKISIVPQDAFLSNYKAYEPRTVIVE